MNSTKYMQLTEQPREPLTIEFLIYLRNNLTLSQFDEQEPAFSSMQTLLESKLELINETTKNEIEQNIYSKGYFQLIDFARYISLHLLDFLIASRSYITAKTRWSKLFFCRQLALIIYEFIYDINPIINETLKTNEDISKIDLAIMGNLNNTIKKLSFIRQLKYDEYLKIVRNQTTAHRQKNVQELYDLMKNLDERLIIACSLFTFLWVVELVETLEDLPEKFIANNRI